MGEKRGNVWLFLAFLLVPLIVLCNWLTDLAQASGPYAQSRALDIFNPSGLGILGWICLVVAFFFRPRQSEGAELEPIGAELAALNRCDGCRATFHSFFELEKVEGRGFLCKSCRSMDPSEFEAQRVAITAAHARDKLSRNRCPICDANAAWTEGRNSSFRKCEACGAEYRVATFG